VVYALKGDLSGLLLPSRSNISPKIANFGGGLRILVNSRLEPVVGGAPLIERALLRWSKAYTQAQDFLNLLSRSSKRKLGTANEFFGIDPTMSAKACTAVRPVGV